MNTLITSKKIVDLVPGDVMCEATGYRIKYRAEEHLLVIGTQLPCEWDQHNVQCLILSNFGDLTTLIMAKIGYTDLFYEV